jgi:hypothetical protein
MDERDESIGELHPVILLIQALADITAPLNYSPYCVDLERLGPVHSLLVRPGEHDQATPHHTATALAIAARIPVVAPVVILIPKYGWAGVPCCFPRRDRGSLGLSILATGRYPLRCFRLEGKHTSFRRSVFAGTIEKCELW